MRRNRRPAPEVKVAVLERAQEARWEMAVAWTALAAALTGVFCLARI